MPKLSQGLVYLLCLHVSGVLMDRISLERFHHRNSLLSRCLSKEKDFYQYGLLPFLDNRMKNQAQTSHIHNDDKCRLRTTYA